MFKVIASEDPKYPKESSPNTAVVIAKPGQTLRPEQITPEEETLVKYLRREADQGKDEFATHAFQALSISSIALGGILYLMFYQGGFPAIGLAAGPILLFALVTCRMGTSAYGGANRANGYELYLYRVRTIDGKSQGRWEPDYRSIEWEAAMRAWRVVQTTLFEAVYVPGRFWGKDRYRPGFDPAKKAQWFSQLSLVDETGSTWYAGTYLSRMHLILFLLAGAATGILLVTPFAVFLHPIDVTTHGGKEAQQQLQLLMNLFGVHHAPTIVWLDGLLAAVCVLIALVSAFILVRRIRSEIFRRQIMEDGILSIHSSAIVWQAVVVAHFNALRRARACGMTSWELAECAALARSKRKYRKAWKAWWADGTLSFEDLLKQMDRYCNQVGEADGAGLSGYTFWLSDEAASLARCAKDVPGWVGEGEAALRRKGVIVGSRPWRDFLLAKRKKPPYRPLFSRTENKRLPPVPANQP